MRILLLLVKKDNVISLNTFVHVETSSVIIIIIVIVCLQLLVTDQGFTKEYCGVLQFFAVHILENWMYMCETRLVTRVESFTISQFCEIIHF